MDIERIKAVGGINALALPVSGASIPGNLVADDVINVFDGAKFTPVPDIPPTGSITYSEPGTYTFVVPERTHSLVYEVNGAGGGGAGGASQSTNDRRGGRGGNGAKQEGEIDAAPGQEITVTVGRGGWRTANVSGIATVSRRGGDGEASTLFSGHPHFPIEIAAEGGGGGGGARGGRNSGYNGATGRHGAPAGGSIGGRGGYRNENAEDGQHGTVILTWGRI